jgi:glycosyltransferase involved in cell wall biosynthesis
MLRVSIITVCYNSAETIEATIQSVMAQDYAHIEYILIDGHSNDNTLEIIHRYKENIALVVSEKDEGIYFAINKGIALATGDIIAILHADDFYTNNMIISTVVQAFQTKKVDTVYGDLQYVDRHQSSKITRHWKAGMYEPELFLEGWMPPHPAFFVKKACYTAYGVYNTALRSSADYELMLRLLYKHRCSVFYIPEVLVKMRVGGQSNKSLWNRIQANREDKMAWKLNGLKPGWLTFIRKPLSKLKQFFEKE